MFAVSALGFEALPEVVKTLPGPIRDNALRGKGEIVRACDSFPDTPCLVYIYLYNGHGEQYTRRINLRD